MPFSACLAVSLPHNPIGLTGTDRPGILRTVELSAFPAESPLKPAVGAAAGTTLARSLATRGVRASPNRQEKQRVKRCAACGRDIPESATVCEQCEKWAAVHVAAPSSPAKAPSRPSEPGLPRRELLVIVLAIAGAAIITFGLLLARGGPSSAVVAATVAPRAAQPEPPAPSQTWSVERRAYWTANQRHSDAFELPAENTVPIWMNQVRPLLVVRCISNRTEVFVFTGSALKIEPDTEDHTVTYRFDDEPERSERWPDSAEHDALFAPVGTGTEIAQRVLGAHSLRFGYTPHNAAPVVAQFSVSGLRELIEPVAKDCGWKK